MSLLKQGVMTIFIVALSVLFLSSNLYSEVEKDKISSNYSVERSISCDFDCRWTVSKQLGKTTEVMSGQPAKEKSSTETLTATYFKGVAIIGFLAAIFFKVLKQKMK